MQRNECVMLITQAFLFLSPISLYTSRVVCKLASRNIPINSSW